MTCCLAKDQVSISITPVNRLSGPFPGRNAFPFLRKYPHSPKQNESHKSLIGMSQEATVVMCPFHIAVLLYLYLTDHTNEFPILKCGLAIKGYDEQYFRESKEQRIII